MAGEEKKEQKRDGSETSEAEMAARLEQEIQNLPVSDHLLIMLQSLSGLAVARLGLTGQAGAKRDLEQARLAIEAFRALMGVLEGVRLAGEMTAYRGMLSQLQLAFASVTSAPAAGSRPAPGAETEESEAVEAPPMTAEGPLETGEAPPESAESPPAAADVPAEPTEAASTEADASSEGDEAPATEAEPPAKKASRKPRRPSQGP